MRCKHGLCFYSPECKNYSAVMHSVPQFDRDFASANKLVQAGLKVIDYHLQRNPKLVFIMENPMMVCYRCQLLCSL